jgi:hypothetical protein
MGEYLSADWFVPDSSEDRDASPVRGSPVSSDLDESDDLPVGWEDAVLKESSSSSNSLVRPEPSILDPDVTGKLEHARLDILPFFVFYKAYQGVDVHRSVFAEAFKSILSFVYASKAHVLKFSGGCNCGPPPGECKCNRAFLGFFARKYAQEVDDCGCHVEMKLFRLHLMHKRGFYSWDWFCYFRELVISEKELKSGRLWYFLREDGSIAPEDITNASLPYFSDAALRCIALALAGYKEGSLDCSLLLETSSERGLPLIYAIPLVLFLFTHLPRGSKVKRVFMWCIAQKFPIKDLMFLHTEMRSRRADVFKKVPGPFGLHQILRVYPCAAIIGDAKYVASFFSAFPLKIAWELMTMMGIMDEITKEFNHKSMRSLLRFCHKEWTTWPPEDSLKARIYDRIIVALMKAYPALTALNSVQLFYWIRTGLCTLEKWIASFNTTITMPINHIE